MAVQTNVGWSSEISGRSRKSPDKQSIQAVYVYHYGIRKAPNSLNAYRPCNATRSKRIEEYSKTSSLALLLLLLLLTTASSASRRFSHQSTQSRHSGNVGHARHPRHTLHILHLGHGLLERVIADAAATERGRVDREDLGQFPTPGSGQSRR